MTAAPPSIFQPLIPEDEATYGPPAWVRLRLPDPPSERCRRKLENWLAWRGASYPASRHSEYLHIPAGHPACPPGPEPRIVLAAVLPTPASMEEYLAQIPPHHRRSVQSRKALHQGYTVRPIHPREHARAIWEVIHSSDQRQGRAIAPMFATRPPDFDFPEYVEYGHPLFDDICTGVFTPGGTLVAYLLGRRVGDHVQYDEIMGHAAHVQYNVMYLLHWGFLQQCVNAPAPPACLNYGSWYSGAQPFSAEGGLNRWKRKTRFKPAYLTLASS